MDILTPIGAEMSVADRIRENLDKAYRRKNQELLFPGSENLYIVFRPIDDFGEFKSAIAADELSLLDENGQEIAAYTRTLVASSIGSYAVIDGKRHEIGFPLGAQLYEFIYGESAAPDGLPLSDTEAVALMFQGDTVSMAMFARKLSVWQKLQQALVESESGESFAAIQVAE